MQHIPCTTGKAASDRDIRPAEKDTSLNKQDGEASRGRGLVHLKPANKRENGNRNLVKKMIQHENPLIRSTPKS